MTIAYKEPIIYFYGNKKELENSKLFLPYEAFEKIYFIEKIDNDFLKKMKEDFCLTRVALIKAGYGFSIGFWEFLLLRKIGQKDIITLPLRTALDVPNVVGKIDKYGISALEEGPINDPYITIGGHFLMAHGLILYDILKDGIMNAEKNARLKKYDVKFTTDQAVYLVTKNIINFLLDKKDAIREVKQLTTDINNILDGTYKEKKNKEKIIETINNQIENQSEARKMQETNHKFMNKAFDITTKSLILKEKRNRIKKARLDSIKNGIQNNKYIPDDIKNILNKE